MGVGGASPLASPLELASRATAQAAEVAAAEVAAAEVVEAVAAAGA